MRKFLFLGFLLFAASCISEAGAQGKGIDSRVLPNGLTVLIKPTESSGLASVYIKIACGQSSDTRHAGSGITHFIEHMIFKGTPESESGDLAKKIKALGGYVNANTGFDATTYFAVCPAAHIEECIELLGAAVMDPAFRPEDVEKERAVILNELRMREDRPETKLTHALFETAYLIHPYKYPIIGYEDLFKRISREELIAFYKRFYAPNNMVVSVAGGVDVEKIADCVAGVFGKYEMAPDPALAVPAEPEQISGRVSKRYEDVNVGYFAMGFHTVGVMNKDLFALDILSNVLGQGDGSRLNRSLVKGEKVLYSIGSYNYTPRYPGLFVVSAAGDKDMLEKGVSGVWDVIERVKREGILPEEFEKAKAGTLMAYYSAIESTASTAGIMAEDQMFTGDPDFSRKYVKELEKVTSEDVVLAAKNYITRENCSVVYLLPKAAAPAAPAGESETHAAGQAGPELVTLHNGMRLVLINR